MLSEAYRVRRELLSFFCCKVYRVFKDFFGYFRVFKNADSSKTPFKGSF